MTTTTFVAGTTVASSWLNDVNSVVYSNGSNIVRNPSGNWTIPSASGGDTLTLGVAVPFTVGLRIFSSAGIHAQLALEQSGQQVISIYNPASTNDLKFFLNGADRVTFGGAGNVTIAAPNSGDSVTINNGLVGSFAVRSGLEANSVVQAWWNGNTTLNQASLRFNAAVTRFGSDRAGGSLELTTAASATFLTANATGSVTIAPSVAITAGGSKVAGVSFTSTADFGVFTGSGAPSISAAKGSLYLRSDGTTTTSRAYINTDGGTTWTAITTVA
jgi:hypothetical protein